MIGYADALCTLMRDMPGFETLFSLWVLHKTLVCELKLLQVSLHKTPFTWQNFHENMAEDVISLIVSAEGNVGHLKQQHIYSIFNGSASVRIVTHYKDTSYYCRAPHACLKSTQFILKKSLCFRLLFHVIPLTFKCTPSLTLTLEHCKNTTKHSEKQGQFLQYGAIVSKL